MLIVLLKVLGGIWLASLLLLGLIYLWCKFTQTPFTDDYDGEDF